MAANLVSTGAVHEVLTEKNYKNWSVCVKNYLQVHDLWDTVNEEFKGPKYGNEFEIFKKQNVMALHVIQISCGPQILSKIRRIPYANKAWKFLANKARKRSSDDAPNDIENSEFLQYIPLLKAVDSGDWDDVDKFLQQNPGAKRATLSDRGMTALHVAVSAGHVKIVEELVKLMSVKDLEIQTMAGYTALSMAASIGITEIAECMVNKNENLVSIGIKKKGTIPVALASGDILRYLYKVTPLEQLTGEKEINGATVVVNCIISRMFDVALDLLQRCPSLAYALDNNGCSAVSALVQIHSAFPSGSRLQFWKRWIYKCIHVPPPRPRPTHPSNGVDINIQIPHQEQTDPGNIVTSDIQRPQQQQTDRRNILTLVSGHLNGLLSCLSKLFGIRQMYNTKLTHIQVLELLHCICKEISKLTPIQLKKAGVYDAIGSAIRHGIVEFIIVIITFNPNFLWKTDSNKRGIFLSAVVHHQEKIFSLIYTIGAKKATLVDRTDYRSNNMLHLAGMLSSSTQLDDIPGAALQMQRELQWYKEVESIVHPRCKELRNNDGLTPGRVFSKNHEKLLKEAEKWMKETASSCTVVTALIVTIMFAAAFTLPGGNDGNTGLPMFINKKLFMVFIVCDAMSLFSSTTSLLIFLGILTSRYGEEYFLKSLPTKMILGLTTLFMSTATMMIAFSSALLLMLQGPYLSWVFFPTIVLAGVPVIIFILLQSHLLVKIFMSTYGPSIFNRKTNNPWAKARNFVDLYPWKKASNFMDLLEFLINL